LNAGKNQSWSRELHPTPTTSILVGFALGSLVGFLAACPWFDRLSFIMGLPIALLGGIWGYIVWLSADRSQGDLFWRAAALVTALAFALLLLAYPGLWHVTGGPLRLSILLGGLGAACIPATAVAWGVMQFASRGLFAASRPRDKPCDSNQGVWDGELDLTLSSKRRKA